MKQQYNVNLPPELIRRTKYASLDAQLSLSDFTERALVDHLERIRTMRDITLQPMVHVTDVAGTVRLLELLGGTVVSGSRDGDWAQVAVGGAEVGLLAHPANPDQGEGDVELNFASSSLDALHAAAAEAGVEVASPVTDEAFGRQLQLRTPDGLLIKINEIDPELIR